MLDAVVLCENNRNFELAHLKKKKKKKKKEKHFGCLATSWLGTFMMPSHGARRVVGHETLKNEQYIAMKAYKVSFLRFKSFFLSMLSLPIESTDSIRSLMQVLTALVGGSLQH